MNEKPFLMAFTICDADIPDYFYSAAVAGGPWLLTLQVMTSFLLISAVGGALAIFGYWLELAWGIVASIIWLRLFFPSPYRAIASINLKSSKVFRGEVRGGFSHRVRPGSKRLVLSQTGITLEDVTTGITSSLKWPFLSEVKVIHGSVILRAKFSERPGRILIFAYIPAWAFSQPSERDELVEYCRSHRVSGGNSSPQPPEAGVANTEAPSALPEPPGLTIRFARVVKDITTSLEREMRADNALVVDAFIDLFTWPTLLLLTILPLWGTKEVGLCFGILFAVPLFFVFFRGRVATAVTIQGKSLRRQARKPTSSAALFGLVEYRLTPTGVGVSLVSAGMERFIPWPSLLRVEPSEQGIYIDGAEDPMGKDLFIPARAFDSQSEMVRAADMARVWLTEGVRQRVVPSDAATR